MRVSFYLYFCSIMTAIFWGSVSALAQTGTEKEHSTPKVEILTVTRSKETLLRGGGLITPQHGTQARSVIGQPLMDVVAPTSTAFQIISTTPGANIALSDPFGMSPQTTMSLRGLNSDSMGAVLEGMPMNDLAYYVLSPGQFADSENYSEVALQQGSADLDSPVINATGGLLSLHYRDPSLKPGGMASFSYGSYNMRRGFIRLDTGELGQSGLRGFISYSNSYAENWRGSGDDSRHHIDFKLLKEWGEGNRIALLGSWNHALNSYYPEVTRQSWQQDGIHGANNLNPHYDKNHPLSNGNYWKFWHDPMDTLYVGAPVHVRFDDHFSLDITPYAQRAYGSAPSGMVLNATGNAVGNEPIGSIALPGNANAAMARADYTQKSYRSGFTAALHAKAGWNNFVLGYWYDYSDDHERQTFNLADAYGHAGSIWGQGHHIHLADGRLLKGADFHTMAQVNAIFIGDHISLFHNRLAMDIGFKEIMLSRTGSNNLPGPQYRVGHNSAQPLPRFGLRWNFTPKDQLFFNATTNFRAPAVTAYYDSYEITSPIAEGKGSPNLKDEYSIAEEIGYRRNGDIITGSITFFNYNFTNRQIMTILRQNGSEVSSTINAGGQTSRGVDIEIGTRPWHHFSPYLSFEYLNATIDNNIAVSGDTLHTAGKIAVRSPHVQGALGLRYDDGHLFGLFTARYTGSQYSTFMNDEKMPSHITADLNIGYRFSDYNHLKAPTLMLNFMNITNQHYLSGVSSPQLNAHQTLGQHGTLIAGNAPQYYIGGGFAVLFSARAGF